MILKFMFNLNMLLVQFLLACLSVELGFKKQSLKTNGQPHKIACHLSSMFLAGLFVISVLPLEMLSLMMFTKTFDLFLLYHAVEIQ